MQFLFSQPVETFNHSPHQQQPSITQSHFISLPRVVAIIAEALAVEVLPPDHPAKARLIGIVKQVQVKIKTLFFCSRSKLNLHVTGKCWSVRGLRECSLRTSEVGDSNSACLSFSYLIYHHHLVTIHHH